MQAAPSAQEPNWQTDLAFTDEELDAFTRDLFSVGPPFDLGDSNVATKTGIEGNGPVVDFNPTAATAFPADAGEADLLAALPYGTAAPPAGPTPFTLDLQAADLQRLAVPSVATASSDAASNLRVDAVHEEPSRPNAAVQLASAKEKNRQSQKRYRERERRRRQDTNAKIAELESQLAELKMQQVELTSRNALYERLLATQQSVPPAASPTAGVAASAAAAKSATDAAGKPGDQDGCWQKNSWANSETLKLAFGGGQPHRETLTFTARQGVVLRMTRHEVAQMTVPELGALWKDIINGLAGCLLRADNDLGSPAGVRMMELLRELKALKSTLGILQPDTLENYAQAVDQQHGATIPETWQSIAVSLKLSPVQKVNATKLRNAAFTSLGALLRQRSELSQGLVGFPKALADAAAFSASSNDVLASRSTAAELHSMLREENSYTAQLNMTLFGRVLTPFQTAHANVLAFPHGVSCLALLNAIADGADDAVPIQELLQQGAASSEKSPPLYEAAQNTVWSPVMAPPQ